MKIRGEKITGKRFKVLWFTVFPDTFELLTINCTCLVKVDVARHQQEEDAQRAIPTPTATGTSYGQDTSARGGPGIQEDRPKTPQPSPEPTPHPNPTTFIGSVKLNEERVGRDAGQIADEILSHLTSLPGVEATISMEIEIKVPGGVEGHVVRIVKENANALNFEDALFEDE
ncbi:MAG: hypothetical protein QF569_10425 [Candidatus Poribacteria bacterium]|jgi:hypothetical protein|nr:hypothetical protein [Candidatus Poribacteria bacterium]